MLRNSQPHGWFQLDYMFKITMKLKLYMCGGRYNVKPYIKLSNTK